MLFCYRTITVDVLGRIELLLLWLYLHKRDWDFYLEYYNIKQINIHQFSCSEAALCCKTMVLEKVPLRTKENKEKDMATVLQLSRIMLLITCSTLFMKCEISSNKGTQMECFFSNNAKK